MEGDERGGYRNQSIVRMYEMSKICLMWGGEIWQENEQKRVKCEASFICVIFLKESRTKNPSLKVRQISQNLAVAFYKTPD